MEDCITKKVKKFIEKTGANLENTSIGDFALFLKTNNLSISKILDTREEDLEKFNVWAKRS